MIASLMMYRRAALDGAHIRLWDLIRHELSTRGMDAPTALSQDTEEFSVWRDPDLVLSQTCGMPYRIWLHDTVHLVGTPDYGLDGCPAGYYRSALVVRSDDPRSTVAAFRDGIFAYNQTFSQSGYAAPYWHLHPHGFWFENRLHTGQHLLSATSVAEGRADIAALDAVSWRLMQAHEPFAQKLRVLDWTAPTPGLPLITGAKNDPELVFDAVAAAIAALDAADRSALGLRGIVAIKKAEYLAVRNPDA